MNQKLEFPCQREAAPEIKACAVLAADCIRSLVKDFPPEIKGFGERILQEDAREPPVLVASTGIDPVTPSPIGSPLPEVFLEPYRQEILCLSITKTFMSIAGWDFYQRKRADIGKNSGPMSETVFYAYFRVAVTEMGGPPLRRVKGNRRDEMKLSIREDAVVKFCCRSDSADSFGISRTCRKKIYLTMLIFDRLRIIRTKRRASRRLRRDNET